MIEEVRLPEISENVDSGEVIDVLVKAGDFVDKDQSIAELETEKAAFEVPCPVKGKVVEVNIKEGDTVKVNQVIIKVDTEAKAEEKTENYVPRETVKEQQKPEEKKQMQEEVRPERKEPQKVIREVQEPPAEPEAEIAVHAAPSVLQLARELGVNLRHVTGTGEDGMITSEDVMEYARNLISGQAGKPAAAISRPLPDFSKWGDIERVRISATRKKISETVAYAWSNVPQVTQYDRADITGLEESRKLYIKKYENNNSKLSITSVALKVVSLAMKEFPNFNSSFDSEKNEIIYKKYFNISVAVDTDRGLLVPVIRDVDKKSIIQLSDELNSLAEKTRRHSVTADDMVGGNFTISNLGGIGGTNFSPIIYWPQAAILGISHAAMQPYFTSGSIQPRLILPLSLSYDHRIIDGAEALRFIRLIVQYLENPLLLSLY